MRKEMAQFLIKLYQSDEVVGLVDVKTLSSTLVGHCLTIDCYDVIKKLMNLYFISFLRA